MNWLWKSTIGSIIMTVIISMAPVVELRGAIPIAVAKGLDFRIAIIAAIIGNLIPVPFIIIFIRKIFAWLRKKSDKLDKFVSKLEKRAEKKSAIVEKYKMLGLCILVAIPLPGTGAWTGALVAAMLEMRLKQAFPPIALGVVIAGVIVALATYGVGSVIA